MMQILVGTSGWVYKDWATRFYPDNLKSKDQLAYFASHFNTVEINSTFYRLPTEAAVQNWHDSVPPDFIFSIKLSRYLTHIIKLEPGRAFNEGLLRYCARVQLLRSKLGAVLVQLPASFHAEPRRIVNLSMQFKKMERKFNLPLPLACEFRHKSWFTPDILNLLSEHKMAAVVASGPGRWPQTRQITTDFAFIRFHGDKHLYASSYSNAELNEWASYIKSSCRNCTRVFCYFNNDKGAKAVDNAKYLASRLS